MHDKEIQETAKKENKTPKKFVDELSKKFKEAWNFLNIKPSRFIRTTDKDHEKLVQDIIKKCNKNGDIYKGFYEGQYCIGCEEFKRDLDLVEGKCSIHTNKDLEEVSEENYFFKLTKYKDSLLEWFDSVEFLTSNRLSEELRNYIL